MPDVTIGTPYSYQLTAIGGSGNYTWWIDSGTLPEGLSLSPSGLISGTPTSSDTTVVRFGVLDTLCASYESFAITPGVTLSTRSTTKLQKYKGYAAFTDRNSSTLYKKITWSGQVIQTALTSDGWPCAGAKIVYSGYDEINAAGEIISRHQKDLFVMCPSVVNYPRVAEGDNAAAEVVSYGMLSGASTSRIHTLVGYCWKYDPNSCSNCPTSDASWSFKENRAVPAQFDLPTELLIDQTHSSIAATQYGYNHSITNAPFAISGVNAFPGIPAGANYADITISSVGSFNAILSDPYTDADAVSSEEIIHGTSKISENLPTYLNANFGPYLRSIITRMTTVDYTLECKHLIPGRSYEASVTTEDNEGEQSIISQTFIAISTEQTVTGTIPQPDAGKTTKVNKPRVRIL